MTRRFNAIGVCLFGFVSAGLIACGDGGESKEGPWPTGEGGAKPEGGSTSTGGKTGTGGTTAVEACTASFVNLVNGSFLSDADDADGDYCQNGYSYDVTVASTAPDGTTARLILNGSEVATTTVANAVAKFAAAPLGNQGEKTLAVEIGDGKSGCATSEVKVTIDCLGMPSCNVTAATFDATQRTALNAVAVAQSGDRVSSLGSPYQSRFTVSTNVENGQPVAITVDESTDKVYGVAVDGVATFPGVTLTPDGNHRITATCTARSGAAGVSSPLSVNVDTLAPDLTLTKGSGSGTGTLTFSDLANGDHFGPADDADTTKAGLQLKLCGTTTSADAADLASVLAATKDNFCAALGGNTATCGPVVTADSKKVGCVNFTCPGNGPFDLSLTLKDSAQNPATITRTGLTCAATNPTVTFIDPVANDATFSDKSKRILASYNTEATRQDMNPAVAGSQYIVSACTSAAAGSQGALKVGRKGEMLVQMATATSVASTACTGSKFEFPMVNLPESLTNADYTLKTPSQISVTSTDKNLGATTEFVDVWVDSNSPTLTLNSPFGLCGKYYFSPVDVTETVVFGASVASVDHPVTLVVTGPDAVPVTYQGTTLTFSQASIPNVLFKVGKSTLTARVTEPSGNFRVLSSTCAVDVGQNPPPTVTWQTPVATSLLTAPGNTSTGAIVDSDVTTAATGWQGTLNVCTNLAADARTGVTVQFSANGVAIGAPVPVNVGTGCAVLANATVPEGAAMALTATTSAGAAGSGTATITIPVDVTVPSVPLNPASAVKDRRATSFDFTWRVPADGAGTPSGYQVKVSTAVITDANFDAAESVTYSGTPGVVGSDDGSLISGRLIEKDYYFAVRAVDLAGNKGGIANTVVPTKASFVVQELKPPVSGAKEMFGWVVDGGSDLNGDGYSDFIVATQTGTSVYVYFGGPVGIATVPSVTISGDPYFGYAAAGIGDVNGDGIDDLAIGNQLNGDGTVDVFYGSKAWVPGTTLTNLQANARLSVDSGLEPKYQFAGFGYSIARLGDTNGDGIDDFSIGTPFYNFNAVTGGCQGQAAVVFGVSFNVGGLASTIVLPAAFGSGVMRIDGDETTSGYYGMDMVGIGRFYSNNTNNVLVVAAPFSEVGANAAAGELFAYAGVSGTPPASLPVTSYSSYIGGTVADPAGASGLGMNGLGVMGNFGPESQPVLGAFYPYHPEAPGRVQLFSGGTSSTSGPFDSNQWLASSITGPSRRFGRLVVGGAIRGTNTMLSYLGTSKSDIILTTRVEGNPRLLIVDGTKLSVAGGLTNADTLADVVMQVPVDITEFGYMNTPARDLDKDTYADFAIGEASYSGAIDGRVWVYR